MIESLLAKPSSKPNFAMVAQSDVLKKVQAFLPAFISSTDRILSDPQAMSSHMMDIKIRDQSEKEPEEDDQIPHPGASGLTINMVSHFTSFVVVTYSYRKSVSVFMMSRTNSKACLSHLMTNCPQALASTRCPQCPLFATYNSQQSKRRSKKC